MLPTGRLIKAARILVGWSQDQLARNASVGRNSLLRLEAELAASHCLGARGSSVHNGGVGLELSSPSVGMRSTSAFLSVCEMALPRHPRRRPFLRRADRGAGRGDRGICRRQSPPARCRLRYCETRAILTTRFLRRKVVWERLFPELRREPGNVADASAAILSLLAWVVLAGIVGLIAAMAHGLM